PPWFETAVKALTSSPMPELSIYVTSARFSNNFLFPFPSSPRISSRNWAQPSPSVILPLTSTTLTESTWRIVAFMLTVGSSFDMLQIRIYSLHHGYFRARTLHAFHPEIIHKGT